MKLTLVQVTGFRMLRDVRLHLDDLTTVIVGRNNSGKTSLTELLRRIFAEQRPVFTLEDFSLGVHENFWKAYELAKSKDSEDDAIRRELPVIEVRFTIDYEDAAVLGALSDFIIDLNPSCHEAQAIVRYELDQGKTRALFESVKLDGMNEAQHKEVFFKTMRERIPRLYKAMLWAEDPNDSTNKKALEWRHLSAIMRAEFINAQRGLDDVTHRENDVLGKVLCSLFETAKRVTAGPTDKGLVEKLEQAIATIQDDLDEEFNKQLNGLLPGFAQFGYPSLPDPGLLTETTFDVERLLNNHTKILYPGANGVHLPEAYNGLGARNLIFILLKLHAFYKSFQTAEMQPCIHLIFIEEPEAHLHPQMQEVFIEQLGKMATQFAQIHAKGEKWPIQFAVTTHSSHIANRAPFKTTRYFLARAVPCCGAQCCETTVKDLGTAPLGMGETDDEFLYKYMTLTRCDLLFADKVVLIEGASERLLLPKMIEKHDAAASASGRKLSSQYVSIMEVGGAYAHRFRGLLDFLELPSLIITDLDSVKKGDKGKLKACKVSEGTTTSNACIKDWFSSSDTTPTALLARTEDEKISGVCRIAYQVPERKEAPCGRSLEQAFMLANLELFSLDATSAEDDSWELASEQKKSSFALEYAIKKPEWKTPKYIVEGLVWLSNAEMLARSAADPATVGDSSKSDTQSSEQA